jgi:hypothetical protein
MKKVYLGVTVLSLFLVNGCLGKSNVDGLIGNKTVVTSTAEANGLKEVQIDYNGHSSEGGSIYAYYDKETLKYFELYLFGEQGKDVYRFDINTPDEVAVLKSDYTYDKAISEGDVKIISQTDARFIIKSDKAYSLTNSQESLIHDDQLLALFNSAIKVIKNGNGTP